MPTIKPLDSATVIQAANQTGAIVTAEEHSVTGGLGSATAEVLAESGLTISFRRFGVPDRLNHTVGSQSYLRRNAGDLRQVVLSLLRSSAEREPGATGQAPLVDLRRFP
jgi:transketolase